VTVINITAKISSLRLVRYNPSDMPYRAEDLAERVEHARVAGNASLCNQPAVSLHANWKTGQMIRGSEADSIAVTCRLGSSIMCAQQAAGAGKGEDQSACMVLNHCYPSTSPVARQHHGYIQLYIPLTRSAGLAMSWPSPPDEAPHSSSCHIGKFLPSPFADSAFLNTE